MRILQINASARREASHSTRLADALVERLVSKHTQAGLVRRDLAHDPVPMLDEWALQALFTPVAERTPEQAARVAIDDRVIAEVQAADILVLGVPMYNFGVPAQLKAWIDALARAGVTFRYTAQGPEGLLRGKKVYVALARGGLHRGTESDSQVPYLKTVFGFLGMTDLNFVYAEGLALGPESEAKGLAAAELEIAEAI
ncbi:FMN reductase [Burkholderiales bacterium]|nr:MAG: FMN-dependent NADH-azoreductase [Burkholderiales bacterium]CAG1001726.1 FMN reductase [Burkholderiales bacterium]